MEGEQLIELAPLPISKHTRVWMEAVRTAAAFTSAMVNATVLLKVFKVI